MRRDGSAGLSDTDICRANRINPSFSRPSVSLHLFLFHSTQILEAEIQKNLEAELLKLSITIRVMRFKDELSCNVAKFSFRWVFWGFMKPAGLQSSKVSISKSRRSREDKKVIKSNLHFPQRKRRATNHSLHVPGRVPGQTGSLSEWERFQFRLFRLIIYPQTDIFWLRPKSSSHACVGFCAIPPLSILEGRWKVH